MDPKVAIGIRISTARIELGYNQSELARLVGVSAQAVQQWEKGETTPRGGNLSKVSEVLRISAKYLQFGDDKDNTDKMAICANYMRSKAFEKLFHDTVQKMIENGEDMGWISTQSQSMIKPLADIGLMHLRNASPIKNK
jgi:transcriptional regulator with XRE-family HTH domain